MYVGRGRTLLPAALARHSSSSCIQSSGVLPKLKFQPSCIYVYIFCKNKYLIPVILLVPTTYEEGTECPKTSVHKIQTPENHPKEKNTRVNELNVTMHVAVDPASSGISGPERGGSVTLYSGNIERTHGIQATSIRGAYSDISSQVLKDDAIPRFPGKSLITSH